MAKKSRAGNSYKIQYKAYQIENRFVKNKKSKLEKHCLANPTDEVASKALEKNTWPYKRNRKSAGHSCKEERLHVFNNPGGQLPASAGDQLVELGIVNEKKYTKSLRFGKYGVLRR